MVLVAPPLTDGAVFVEPVVVFVVVVFVTAPTLSDSVGINVPAVVVVPVFDKSTDMFGARAPAWAMRLTPTRTAAESARVAAFAIPGNTHNNVKTGNKFIIPTPYIIYSNFIKSTAHVQAHKNNLHLFLQNNIIYAEKNFSKYIG